MSGQKGGDLGPLQEGQVDAIFFNAAFALRRGEVSKRIPASSGYHVVQSLDEPR